MKNIKIINNFTNEQKSKFGKVFYEGDLSEFNIKNNSGKIYKFSYQPRLSKGDGNFFPAEFKIEDKEEDEEYCLLTNNYDDNFKTGMKHFEDEQTGEKWFRKNLKIIKKIEEKY